MAERSSRRGAVDMGVVLMVLSFVVIGFFLFWLQGQAAIERASTPVVEDATGPDPDDPFADAPSVTGTDLAMGEGAGRYVGQVVRVAPTPVVGQLGRQGFWLEFPQANFLVSYSPALLADSVVAAIGSTVSVTGAVRTMTDSVAAAWFESGRIGEGDQIAATFVPHFIEAERIQTGARGGN